MDFQYYYCILKSIIHKFRKKNNNKNLVYKMEKQFTPFNKKVENNGDISIGWFNEPFEEINLINVLKLNNDKWSLKIINKN